MNTFNQELGNLIKAGRLKKNISTYDLAKELKISGSKLNNIENATNDCFQTQLLIDISTNLEINIFDFIFKTFKTDSKENAFQIQLITNKLLHLSDSTSQKNFDLIVSKILSDITLFESITESRN